MMVKFVEKDFARWPSLLAGISLAYNSTVHTSTGFAPHELFYSFPPSCPFDIVVEADRTEATSGADQYALEATDRLKQAFQFVYEFTGRVAERMKSNYDASIKPKSFEVGAFVLVYTPPKQQQRQVYGKWKIPWQGPYKVIKKLNATNYVVKRSSRAKDFIVHGDRMKPYFGEIDATAWPADRQDSQQSGPASAGIASTSDQSSSSQQPLAQLGPAQTDSQQPASGKCRSRDGAGRPARSASNIQPTQSGHTGTLVPSATDINYVNPPDGQPISVGESLASRPKRARRKPARLLASVAAAEVCVGTDRKFVPKSDQLSNINVESVSELSTSETNCRLVELRNNSVDETMPNNGKRSTRKRRRRSSRGRGNQQNGDRPVGVCHPRVRFLPRFCRRNYA